MQQIKANEHEKKDGTKCTEKKLKHRRNFLMKKKEQMKTKY